MAMVHRSKGDLKAFALHKRRKVAMDVVEIGKAQKGFATKGLQSASCVVGRIPQKAFANAVADPRGDLFGGAVLAFYTLAPDEHQLRRTGEQRIDQPGPVSRIILAVAIQGDDHSAARSQDAGADRTALAGVSPVG